MTELVLSDANFSQEIEKSKGLTLVDFWAAWCGPCQMMSPVIEELAKQYAGKIKIAKLNVDENPKTAQKFEVMSIPTLIFFFDGKEKERMIGAHDRETIVEKLESLNK